MGGGSILIGKSQNYEIFLRYSTPSETKNVSGFAYRRKGEITLTEIGEWDAPTEEIQQMLDEFEAQHMLIRNVEHMGQLIPIIDRDKLTLAEIYQRMVKAENSLAIWKKRAEDAEAMLIEIGDFHEKQILLKVDGEED